MVIAILGLQPVNCGIKSFLFLPWQDGMDGQDGAFMILYLERTKKEL